MGQFCTMNITEQCMVALTWTLKDTLGEVLDVLDDPVEFLVGGDDLLPLIQQALQGHGPGAKLDLHIEPEEAFGEYDAELVRVESLSLFPEGIQVGMQFERAAEDGDDEMLYTITEIEGDKVVVDGNHPLAGQNLNFAIEVVDVRAASDEEVTHGHVHGAGGHHH